MATNLAAARTGRRLPIRKLCCFTARAGRGSLRSWPRSPWLLSATCRSLIRPASLFRCWRSPRREPRLRLHHQGQFRRRHHQRHRILGLGNRGALAAKPVMEGKAVLFKRFAGIDSIDLEVSTEDPDEFIDCVKLLGKSWGGINLEDIKAPECFIIEQKLRELLDIPVFHDDQHGTAIIAAAGLINALELTGREIKNHQGGGERRRRRRHRLFLSFCKSHRLAAGKPRPLRHQGRDLRRPHRGHEPVEVGLLRSRPAPHADRGDGGADVFFGLSVKGAVTQDMVK